MLICSRVANSKKCYNRITIMNDRTYYHMLYVYKVICQARKILLMKKIVAYTYKKASKLKKETKLAILYLARRHDGIIDRHNYPLNFKCMVIIIRIRTFFYGFWFLKVLQSDSCKYTVCPKSSDPT